VFYAIDKGSNYDLALYPTSNSIDKIAKLTFAQLLMDKQGQAMMWSVLNAGLALLDRSKIDPAAASKCKTAADVLAAAKATT